jgi:hypothetical protein
MAEIQTDPCAVCEQPMIDPSMVNAIFGAHPACLDSPADIWIGWPPRPPNDAWFYTVESKPANGIKYTRHDLHDEHGKQRIARLEGALNGLCPRLLGGWGGCWCLVSPSSAGRRRSRREMRQRKRCTERRRVRMTLFWIVLTAYNLACAFHADASPWWCYQCRVLSLLKRGNQ